MAHTKSSSIERATSIVLRTAHLMCVMGLGASLLGAPVPHVPAGVAVLASGLALFGMELFARRMHAIDFAGLAVLFKLAVVAVMTFWSAAAPYAVPVFWTLVALSSVSSHAPKNVRHWWPWPVDPARERRLR